MTISHILLLTGETEAGILSRVLGTYNSSLEVTPIYDRAALAAVKPETLATARMISFCSSVIVPREILKALPSPAYNFHPGPPDRPGRYPGVFALYERAPRFGVTVHEMTAAVDAGPIVAAEWFTIPPNADLEVLEGQALMTLMNVFHRLARFLALNPRALPRVYIPWAGTKRAKADCIKLCRAEPGLSQDEIAHRKQVCGILWAD